MLGGHLEHPALSCVCSTPVVTLLYNKINFVVPYHLIIKYTQWWSHDFLSCTPTSLLLPPREVARNSWLVHQTALLLSHLNTTALFQGIYLWSIELSMQRIFNIINNCRNSYFICWLAWNLLISFMDSSLGHLLALYRAKCVPFKISLYSMAFMVYVWLYLWEYKLPHTDWLTAEFIKPISQSDV